MFLIQHVEKDEKITFEIRAQSLNKEKIKYEFSDNYELSSYINNNPTLKNPQKKKQNPICNIITIKLRELI